MYTYCHPLALHDALPISKGPGQRRPKLRHLAIVGGRARDDLGGVGCIGRIEILCRLGRRGLQRPEQGAADRRSEEHTSELESLMRISYAVFCLKKKKKKTMHTIV